MRGGGETGGEKEGELKADALGGGEVTKLGVVLPEPKNISLEGVPLADTEDTVAAGLYTTESVPLPISALRRGGALESTWGENRAYIMIVKSPSEGWGIMI